ncbi:40S ribosomal protein S4-3 [Zea mays]|uniref:40S ribosomal protein S4-3 n=1 Tax=Zea mays TaxID=4577 RepID=A0A1D6P083_MAIZE|nr:40S ribosomal protein S4-3 [Zea mays]
MADLAGTTSSVVHAQEIMDEEMDEDVIVKAVDCSNQSEVDIELKQFIKGYSDALQPELGMKLLIAHGSHQELGKGDSMTNLMINMCDVVHMLMHATEVHYQCPKSVRVQSDVSERIANGTSVHVNTPVQNLNLDIEEQSHKHSISHIQEPNTNNSEGSLAGAAVWDVFRRQDLPKLNEYLAVHREECAARCQAVSSVKYPIYDQTVYLNDYHKKMLKDQYGSIANWLACQLNISSVCGVWVLKLVCLVGFIFLEGLKTIEQITMDSASVETNMLKLCKVRSVQFGQKGIPYLNTYDGRTIRYPDPLIKANNTIKIDLETNKIMDFIKFDVGNVVMVTGGRNTGRVGVIKNREKHKGSFETIHVLLGAFCYV